MLEMTYRRLIYYILFIGIRTANLRALMAWLSIKFSIPMAVSFCHHEPGYGAADGELLLT